jgi:hypothetical protein
MFKRRSCGGAQVCLHSLTLLDPKYRSDSHDFPRLPRFRLISISNSSISTTKGSPYNIQGKKKNMPSKPPKRNLGRCNQPAERRNSTKTPFKVSACTPEPSCYEQSSERGGWYATAWHFRRSLKIGPTSQPQDLIRGYAAMTPGMYRVNLAAKRQAETRFCGQGGLSAQVKPTRYDAFLNSSTNSCKY